MIKIQAANCNLPSVPALSNSLSLSAFPVNPLSLRRVYLTRLFWPIKARRVAVRSGFQHVDLLHHLFPPHHFPIIFNNPIAMVQYIEDGFQ